MQGCRESLRLRCSSGPSSQEPEAPGASAGQVWGVVEELALSRVSKGRLWRGEVLGKV